MKERRKTEHEFDTIMDNLNENEDFSNPKISKRGRSEDAGADFNSKIKINEGAVTPLFPNMPNPISSRFNIKEEEEGTMKTAGFPKIEKEKMGKIKSIFDIDFSLGAIMEMRGLPIEGASPVNFHKIEIVIPREEAGEEQEKKVFYFPGKK